MIKAGVEAVMTPKVNSALAVLTNNWTVCQLHLGIEAPTITMLKVRAMISSTR